MTRGKRKGGRPNILFFGTFSRMAEEEFLDEVTARLRTEDSIYRTMARDIHQAGTVLQTQEVPDAGLGLSHLPARPGRELHGLRGRLSSRARV